MMGPVKGKPADPTQFAPFRPARVLADVGGPRSFTFVPADGELYWAHWFDESADRVRYLVVTFSPALVDRLEAGRISLREALDQPRLWAVDVNNQGEPVAATRTSLDDLPTAELPAAGTFLSPSPPAVLVGGTAGDGVPRVVR
jgi:hypothetical protein